MTTSILATKLYIPRPRPNLVLRPRLIERINTGLHGKLTLISAPAGFGKTTLINNWLHQNDEGGGLKDETGKTLHPSTFILPPSNVAWLSLDERDNDPTRFWTYVVAALQTIEADIGESILPLLQSAQAPPLESLLTALINEVALIPTEVTLVLDDYHVIGSTAVDEALTFLLDHLPPQIHLIITTREDPALPLARYRSRGQLMELRAADLRFTPTESAEFLNQMMGLSLSTEAISALETRTEGWIAGLQLAAISMQGRADPGRFIQAFTGSHHFILEYLIEEVLLHQPDHVRNFLLQTAILDQLSGPLCEAVTGQPDGKGMLATLARSNMFIVPLDDERQWYRYHHLFADVLYARLLDEQSSQVATLHQRAGAWYAQNGLLAEAIHHALAGQDFARAADLVELIWPGMHRTNLRSPELLRWLEAIPDDLIRVRPVLGVGYAWELLNAGQFDAADLRLQAAEGWLNTGGQSPEMLVMDEAEFRLLPAEIASARAYLAQARGDAAGTVTYAQQALDLIPPDDHIRRGPGAALLGLAYWRMGNLEPAHDALAEGMANFQRAGNILFAISGTFGLADIRIAQGRLYEAISIYERALALAMTQGDPTLPGIADLHLGLSELYYEQNKLSAAETHRQRSQAIEIHPGQHVYDYHWCLVQARQKQNQGDGDDALRWLDKAEDLFAQIHIPDFRPVSAIRVRVWLKQGKLAEARRWVQKRGLTTADDISFLTEFEYITLARVLIAHYQQEQDEQTLNQAIVLLNRLLHAAEEGERQGSVIEILILQAVAQAEQVDTAAALAALNRALTLAEPESYVRIFVDEGTPMAQLLSEAATRGIAPDYASRLLAAFSDLAPPTTPPNPPSDLLEPLSERELEVLHLIAQGQKNQEIADALLISLNTVRYHTKNLYGKLSVSKRTQAVAKAQELGLL